MVRRLLFLAAVALALIATSSATPALAQQSPPPSVLPTVVERPPGSPGSTAPGRIHKPTEVKGVVITRPLPRTGNDFGMQVVVGAGLTAAGLAFAVSARLRRQRVTAHAGV